MRSIRLLLPVFLLTAALPAAAQQMGRPTLNAPGTHPPGSHSAAQTPARVFNLRLPNDPETLDWNRAQTTVETYLIMSMMEGLVSFDSQLKVQPALAQSWTQSEDGRTYTFKLRRDVRWSDGIQLKAQDFVYSWKRLLSPLTGALYSYFLFDIEGAEYFSKGKLNDFEMVGIKAIDDYTLQIRLQRPVAHWICIPTFWVTFPMRQDIVEKYGPGWEKPGRTVTLGPYLLVSQEMNRRITLRANPNYYGMRGNIDEIDAQVIPGDEPALMAYESGKLDLVTDLSSQTLEKLSGRSDLKSFQYLRTNYLGFSQTRFPLSDPNVRRAISMAIDRNEKLSLKGGYKAASSFVPPGILGFSPNVGVKFDPINARILLKNAGFNPLQPWSIELITQNFDKPKALANFIAQQLKKNLSINVRIETFDHKDYRSRLSMGAFAMFTGAWAADYPDPDNFLSIFLSSSGNNRPKWSNPVYDDRILQARSLADPKARERAYLESQKLLLEKEAVIAPIYYETTLALVKPRIQNLEISPLNTLLLRKVSIK